MRAMHAHIYTYIRVYVCVHIFVCVYVYVHVCIHSEYVCVYIYRAHGVKMASKIKSDYTGDIYIRIHVKMCVCMYKCISMCVYIHTRLYQYYNLYDHTYIGLMTSEWLQNGDIVWVMYTQMWAIYTDVVRTMSPSVHKYCPYDESWAI